MTELTDCQGKKTQGACESTSAVLVILVLGLLGCTSIPKNTGMPLQFESAERPAEVTEVSEGHDDHADHGEDGH